MVTYSIICRLLFINPTFLCSLLFLSLIEYKVEKPHKIYFEERSVDLCGFGIPYDGIPFVNIGKKVMDCEYGIDRCVAAKRKYMERHVSMSSSYKGFQIENY